MDSARRGRAEPILSQLDGSLNPIRALLLTEWPTHPWEQTFANYFASPVGARLVVATFRTDEFQTVTTGGHDYAYIVADTAGHSRLSTGPTDFLLLRAAGDTLFGVRLQGDGSAFLETRLLRWDLLAVGAKASSP